MQKYFDFYFEVSFYYYPRFFNKNDIVNGWLNYSNNVLTDATSTTFMTSGYIEVKPNTQYTINLVDATSLGSGGIMQYDSNFNWIQPGIPETQVVMTFTTTSTTKYVRFVLRNDAKDNIQFEENTEATEYAPFAGYVVESGSNTKGTWVKYSDGTMIVTRETYETTININVSWGNIFVGGDYTEWEFPVPFINAPDLVLFDVNSTTTNGCFKTSYEPTKITKNSIQNVYVGRGTSASDISFKIHILAIGKWK